MLVEVPNSTQAVSGPFSTEALFAATTTQFSNGPPGIPLATDSKQAVSAEEAKKAEMKALAEELRQIETMPVASSVSVGSFLACKSQNYWQLAVKHRASLRT